MNKRRQFHNLQLLNVQLTFEYNQSKFFEDLQIQIPNGITFYGDFIKLQFDRNYKAGDEYSIAKVNQVEINGSLLNSIIIEEEKHDS